MCDIQKLDESAKPCDLSGVTKVRSIDGLHQVEICNGCFHRRYGFERPDPVAQNSRLTWQSRRV